MMYVSKRYRKNTNDEIINLVMSIDKENLKWYDILMIDYFYHNHENNYDGGLSFFDRLYEKLGHLHPNWDIEGLKQIVRDSKKPISVYEDIIKQLLSDPHDIFYYGI